MPEHSSFRPAWWLPGPHLQTLFPHLFRSRRLPVLRRQRIELPDGDFLDIDWTKPQAGPRILLLHGLEGSARSHYAAGLLRSLAAQGFEAGLLYFRGCSGSPNRLARSYHSGETGDLNTVVECLRAQSARPLYVVGFSLGGNVLLKWLGENPDQSLVEKAVAVSVPFRLSDAAGRLDRGLSRFYQLHLLKKLRQSTLQKASRINLPVKTGQLSRLKSFREFDNEITAPLHGFLDADDYYHRSSSYSFLSRIQSATLILHSGDDPFMTRAAVPGPESLGPGIQLELLNSGGHVGFVAGVYPWKPHYWIDERICHWFS
ncbi:MAG: hydrolase [Thiogranum sp.]|nr:hydrolase [Thiogranum sp.]